MTTIDYGLVSTDDHIIEPPDVWNGRLEAKYRTRAPRVVTIDGAEHWTFEEGRINNIGLSVMAGRSYTGPIRASRSRRASTSAGRSSPTSSTTRWA